ncbi:MAG: hypothetical protein JRJ73_08605 [Deltaproteobacteria bacterium]|nr:hypothetical protein [Deltaproteobacteria bacterium]
MMNGVSWTAGPYGPELDLTSASGQFVKFPNYDPWNFGSDSFTLALLCRIDSIDASGVLISHLAANSQGAGFKASINLGNPSFLVKDGVEAATTDTSGNPVGSDEYHWFHFVCDKNDTVRGLRLYYDGYTPTGRWKDPSLVGSLDNARIPGLFTRDGGDPGSYIEGAIVDFAIYPFGFTDEHVLQYMAEPYAMFYQPSPARFFYVAAGAAVLTVNDASHSHDSIPQPACSGNRPFLFS